MLLGVKSMNQRDGQPLVSVIVPVYNVEKYLARCLDSIVNQTYQNIEIILVNDGSTDASGEICQQYAKNDSRICLFTQENQGLSAARNTGLDHMNGEYVTFVDSDDYISLSFVEILLKALLELKALIAICRFDIIDEEKAGRGTLCSGAKANFRILSRDNIYNEIDRRTRVVTPAVWGKIYLKSIFDGLRFDVGRLHEDAFIFHKIYDRIDTVCYTDTILYYYVQTSNSITRQEQNYWKRSADLLDAGFKRLEYFQDYGKKKYIRKAERHIMNTITGICDKAMVDDKKRRDMLSAVKDRIEQVTGRKKFFLQYFLFCLSPSLYWNVRKAYLWGKSVLAKMRRRISKKYV